MGKLRILIVDDQKLFVDSLKTVLLGYSEIIGEVFIALNGEETLDILKNHHVDIILMDIHMPVMNGIETTKIIHQKYPETKILILTAFGYDEYVKEAMKNGAVGFLLKDISSDELVASIQGANKGLKIISPKIIDKTYRTPSNVENQKSLPEWYFQLTPREKEVLILAQKGYSNDEIAEQLYLSIQTVKNYLSSIYEKMEVKNRFQAMRLAMEYKIDTLPIVIPRTETDRT